MKRSYWIGLGVALLVVGGGAGYFILQQQQRTQTAAIAQAVLPAAVDLGNWPAELRREINANEQRIRTGDEPAAALAALSRLYHANGFYPEAAACYQGLIEIEPREPRWPHRLAALLANYGRLEEAIPLWEKVVARDPHYVPALVRLGDALLKTNHPIKAAPHYERALKESPDNPYALLGLARIAFAAGRWAEARDHLETAASRTNDAIGSDLLATAYEKLGEAGRAAMLRGRQKAAGTFSDVPDPWLDELIDDCFDTYRVGVASGAAAHGGDLRRAAELIERALRLSPDSVPTLFQRGGLRLRSNDIAGARRDFERCTQLDPNFSDGWAQLAALLRQTGSPLEADRVLVEGLRNCPGSAGLHLDLGRRLAAQGRTDEALAEFRTSIRLRPEEADAYLDAAKALFSRERIDEGVGLLLQAQRYEPDHPSVLTTLAYAAISAGDERNAAQWMRRVRLQPRVGSEARAALGTAFRERFGHFAD